MRRLLSAACLALFLAPSTAFAQANQPGGSSNAIPVNLISNPDVQLPSDCHAATLFTSGGAIFNSPNPDEGQDWRYSPTLNSLYTFGWDAGALSPVPPPQMPPDPSPLAYTLIIRGMQGTDTQNGTTYAYLFYKIYKCDGGNLFYTSDSPQVAWIDSLNWYTVYSRRPAGF